jgi:glycosyltransferase involved in cell wall biosynthesis
MGQLDVAYVLLRFPSLTETFIAEEMRHIQMKGLHLRLYSLLSPREKAIHAVSRQLLSQANYAPGLLSWSLWYAQLYWLLKSPAGYFTLLTTILRQPAPRASFLLKRLVMFLKGIWLAKDLEHTTVELIHVHFAWLPSIAGIIASRLLQVPFTVTTHAYDIYSEQNDLLGLVCSRAQHILTISEANKRAILAQNPGLAPSKVTVLHCGIDMDAFCPPSERPPHKTLEITSIGSLLSKKGHEHLIRACSLLQAQHVDFRCMIVGSGELERQLQDLISRLDLDNRVFLAGAKSQDWIRERLRDSDVFVLACVTNGDATGDRDGIPVAIMEAMAMQLPVVSTPVSGIPELVRNEETGLLVPERDESRLVEAVLRLAQDAKARSRLVENARALVRGEYNIATNTDRLRDIFAQAIRAKHTAAGSPA